MRGAAGVATRGGGEGVALCSNLRCSNVTVGSLWSAQDPTPHLVALLSARLEHRFFDRHVLILSSSRHVTGC